MALPPPCRGAQCPSSSSSSSSPQQSTTPSQTIILTMVALPFVLLLSLLSSSVVVIAHGASSPSIPWWLQSSLPNRSAAGDGDASASAAAELMFLELIVGPPTPWTLPLDGIFLFTTGFQWAFASSSTVTTSLVAPQRICVSRSATGGVPFTGWDALPSAPFVVWDRVFGGAYVDLSCEDGVTGGTSALANAATDSGIPPMRLLNATLPPKSASYQRCAASLSSGVTPSVNPSCTWYFANTAWNMSMSTPCFACGGVRDSTVVTNSSSGCCAEAFATAWDCFLDSELSISFTAADDASASSRLAQSLWKDGYQAVVVPQRAALRRWLLLSVDAMASVTSALASLSFALSGVSAADFVGLQIGSSPPGASLSTSENAELLQGACNMLGGILANHYLDATSPKWATLKPMILGSSLASPDSPDQLTPSGTFSSASQVVNCPTQYMDSWINSASISMGISVVESAVTSAVSLLLASTYSRQFALRAQCVAATYIAARMLEDDLLMLVYGPSAVATANSDGSSFSSASWCSIGMLSSWAKAVGPAQRGATRDRLRSLVMTRLTLDNMLAAVQSNFISAPRSLQMGTLRCVNRFLSNLTAPRVSVDANASWLDGVLDDDVASLDPSSGSSRAPHLGILQCFLRSELMVDTTAAVASSSSSAVSPQGVAVFHVFDLTDATTTTLRGVNRIGTMTHAETSPSVLADAFGTAGGPSLVLSWLSNQGQGTSVTRALQGAYPWFPSNTTTSWEASSSGGGLQFALKNAMCAPQPQTEYRNDSFTTSAYATTQSVTFVVNASIANQTSVCGTGWYLTRDYDTNVTYCRSCIHRYPFFYYCLGDGYQRRCLNKPAVPLNPAPNVTTIMWNTDSLDGAFDDPAVFESNVATAYIPQGLYWNQSLCPFQCLNPYQYQVGWYRCATAGIGDFPLVNMTRPCNASSVLPPTVTVSAERGTFSPLRDVLFFTPGYFNTSDSCGAVLRRRVLLHKTTLLTGTKAPWVLSASLPSVASLLTQWGTRAAALVNLSNSHIPTSLLWCGRSGSGGGDGGIQVLMSVDLSRRAILSVHQAESKLRVAYQLLHVTDATEQGDGSWSWYLVTSIDSITSPTTLSMQMWANVSFVNWRSAERAGSGAAYPDAPTYFFTKNVTAGWSSEAAEWFPDTAGAPLILGVSLDFDSGLLMFSWNGTLLGPVQSVAWTRALSSQQCVSLTNRSNATNDMYAPFVSVGGWLATWDNNAFPIVSSRPLRTSFASNPTTSSFRSWRALTDQLPTVFHYLPGALRQLSFGNHPFGRRQLFPDSISRWTSTTGADQSLLTSADAHAAARKMRSCNAASIAEHQTALLVPQPLAPVILSDSISAAVNASWYAFDMAAVRAGGAAVRQLWIGSQSTSVNLPPWDTVLATHPRAYGLVSRAMLQAFNRTDASWLGAPYCRGGYGMVAAWSNVTCQVCPSGSVLQRVSPDLQTVVSSMPQLCASSDVNDAASWNHSVYANKCQCTRTRMNNFTVAPGRCSVAASALFTASPLIAFAPSVTNGSVIAVDSWSYTGSAIAGKRLVSFAFPATALATSANLVAAALLVAVSCAESRVSDVRTVFVRLPKDSEARLNLSTDSAFSASIAETTWSWVSAMNLLEDGAIFDYRVSGSSAEWWWVSHTFVTVSAAFGATGDVCTFTATATQPSRVASAATTAVLTLRPQAPALQRRHILTMGSLGSESLVMTSTTGATVLSVVVDDSSVSSVNSKLLAYNLTATVANYSLISPAMLMYVVSQTAEVLNTATTLSALDAWLPFWVSTAASYASVGAARCAASRNSSLVSWAIVDAIAALFQSAAQSAQLRVVVQYGVPVADTPPLPALVTCDGAPVATAATSSLPIFVYDATDASLSIPLSVSLFSGVGATVWLSVVSATSPSRFVCGTPMVWKLYAKSYIEAKLAPIPNAAADALSSVGVFVVSLIVMVIGSGLLVWTYVRRRQTAQHQRRSKRQRRRRSQSTTTSSSSSRSSTSPGSASTPQSSTATVPSRSSEETRGDASDGRDSPLREAVGNGTAAAAASPNSGVRSQEAASPPFSQSFDVPSQRLQCDTSRRRGKPYQNRPVEPREQASSARVHSAAPAICFSSSSFGVASSMGLQSQDTWENLPAGSRSCDQNESNIPEIERAKGSSLTAFGVTTSRRRHRRVKQGQPSHQVASAPPEGSD